MLLIVKRKSFVRTYYPFVLIIGPTANSLDWQQAGVMSIRSLKALNAKTEAFGFSHIRLDGMRAVAESQKAFVRSILR